MYWLRNVWRMVAILFTLAIYFALAPFGYIAFAVWMLLPSRRGPEARARALQGIMRRAFGIMHAWISALWLVRFRRGKDVKGALPEGPCVIVANHPTLVDVTSILASFRDVTTIVKPAIYHAFWARPLLQGAAFFPGVTKSPLEIGATVEAAVDRLERGYRVLMFPEGTRSTLAGMHPFGRAAFEVACRANVPVVPIAITCEPRYLSKENPILRPPRRGTPHLRLEVLAPILPASCNRSGRALRDAVQTALRQHLTPAARELETGR